MSIYMSPTSSWYYYGFVNNIQIAYFDNTLTSGTSKRENLTLIVKQGDIAKVSCSNSSGTINRVDFFLMPFA